MSINEPQIAVEATLNGMQRSLEQFQNKHAGKNEFSSRTLLSIAACGRSRALMPAVILAHDQQNVFLLGPLVRLQLDTLLRVYVARVIDDGEHFATFVLNGGEASKYPAESFPELRSRLPAEDPRLTDKAMCLLISEDWKARFQKIAHDDPEIFADYTDRDRLIQESFRLIYLDTNAYVHLSRNHLMDSIVPDSYSTTPRLSGSEDAVGMQEVRETFMTYFVLITDALTAEVEHVLR